MVPDLWRTGRVYILSKVTWNLCVSKPGLELQNCPLTCLGLLPRKSTGMFLPDPVSQFCLESNRAAAHRLTSSDLLPTQPQ